MTLSPLNTALVHICQSRNASRSRCAELQREDANPLIVEFQTGFAAGLSQALNILRVIGEQPVGAANYIAGAEDFDKALANIEALVGPIVQD